MKSVMEPGTHLATSPIWVGEAVELSPGKAVARVKTRPEMCVDERGLVHGSFAFGLADYAAMLAVNDPYVVLGAAEARFLAPVRLGETLVAQAEMIEEKGKKRLVRCSVATDRVVFEGLFTCFVLEKHILES
jgi:acyl-coenzyme A thioesterase PaaI-like protein